MEALVNLVTAGQGIASGAAGYTVFAVLETPRWDTIGAAVVSLAAVLVPVAIKAYRDWKEAGRQEHVKDIETDSRLIGAEVVRRVEAETMVRQLTAEVAELKEQVARLRCPFARDGQSMCDPSEPPGTWLKGEQ